LARVPITVMGWRCERCGHEWIPREEAEPQVCPKCKNPYWNRPRKTPLTYEDFRDVIGKTLRKADKPITWTEIRTMAKLPQKFPNNQWVHRMEKDIKLKRERDQHGIILWHLD
jgi:predicted Zn-ribbon and HTH transcriptional regulator